MIDSPDLVVNTLGIPRIDSPLGELLDQREKSEHYVEETDRVLFDDTLSSAVARGCAPAGLPGFEPAGPRRKIYFDPSKTRAGIVTCGGLCPGLNDVIRGLTLELLQRYGVQHVYGFCNGFQGFVPRFRRPVLDLTRELVSDINEHGGTILGSSRGEQDPAAVVDCLERMGINLLFVIGGDGTIRAAMKIVEEISLRGSRISVIGIPKTIDNDIMFIDQSFGFQTAFSEATKSIRAAHVESNGAPNGVGLVKLMGRHSGFIACYASLAMSDVNFVLIPEVPFQLDGDAGLLAVLRRRLEKRSHAVIVVAEGAGQDLVDAGAALNPSGMTDASGNKRLTDIGPWLRDRIASHFKSIGVELNLKYIDPSYQIRSVPANPHDSVYCIRLAHNAVHAAMSGRTETVIGRWRGRFVHVPMSLTTRRRNTVDPHGDLWMSVLEATGQPRTFA
ncbi:MAG: ATP-dependent 6-phosphofructokinase [Terracidiphilus sp.]|jgi:6-phosphofructokinase 1